MNILVLGGTGFLGRYIVEHLLQFDYPVTVLSRKSPQAHLFSKQVSYLSGDLFKFQEIDLSGFTHIINCSGELKNEALMQTLHIDCVDGLLDKLKNQANVHWIQISSVGVYGRVRCGEVLENTKFSPIGEYERTKAKAELRVKEFCTEQGIAYTIIRPSNVFGIGMPNQSLLQLISMIKRKLFFYIGNNIQDIVMNYVPVEDVASFVALCIKNEAAKNQEFILSDQLALQDFVSICCEELNLENNFYKVPEFVVRMLSSLAVVLPRFPLTSARIDALTMRVRYSNAKALSSLAYRPVVGCRQGLKNYISSNISLR